MSEDYQKQQIGELTIGIDRTRCIGSGNCTKVAPEVFELDETTLVTFREDQEPADRDTLIEACDVCPVDALFVHDKEGHQLVPES